MLRNYLKLDIRRAFFNWKFPACFVLVCILMMYGSSSSCVIYRITFNYSIPLLLIAMAVASVPYVASYVEDSGHKFNTQMKLRGDSKSSYIASRICIVFLSSFVTFAVGFIMSVIIGYFQLGLINQDAYDQILMANSAYVSLIIKKYYILYILAVTVHLSIMAGIMSLIGIILGQLVNNRIAAYCFPLVFVEIQDFLIQRLFGWEKSAGMTLKNLGLNQLTSVLPGQGVGKYYYQVVCYMIIICYIINYVDKRKLNE